MVHIASGDLLRANVRDDTELGRRAKPYMDAGELVPDDLIIDMMVERLRQPDAQAGFVLDGFPRTVAQAQSLDRRLGEVQQQLDAVIYLRVPEEEILRRLSGRLTCPNCNAVYHVDTMAPQQEGACDRCGTGLVQRDDEQPQVVRKRLEVYSELTAPLLDHYRRQGLVHEVDGTIGVDRVLEKISEILRDTAVEAG
jgi:adenylate kinase